MKPRILLLAILGSFIADQALAQSYHDECAGILAQGIFDTQVHVNDYRAKSSFKAFLCSTAAAASESSLSQSLCKETAASRGTKWSGSINVIELLTGSSSGDHHKGFRDKYCSQDKKFAFAAWRNDHCSGVASSGHSSQLTHTLMRSVSSSVVEAWRACALKRARDEDLVCYAAEHGPLILLKVAWTRRNATAVKLTRFDHPNLSLLGSGVIENPWLRWHERGGPSTTAQVAPQRKRRHPPG